MSPRTGGDQHVAPLRLLVVCTANRCRSPMAEAFARRTLADRRIPAEVVSAGRMSGGHQASTGAVDALRRRHGLDISNHRSATLDRDTLTAADLILVMEREHLADVFELQPSALERTFTLGEFPGLLGGATDSADGPADDVRSRIARAHRRRDPGRILAVDPSTDIADPMGKRAGAYRKTARQLERLMGDVVDGLYPKEPG